MTDIPRPASDCEERSRPSRREQKLRDGLVIDVEIVVISPEEAAALAAAQVQALWEVWSWWSETTKQPRAS